MHGKILIIANVVKTHICQFHIPYLKWFHEQGYEVHVAARNDFPAGESAEIPYCDKFFDVPINRSPFNPENLKAYRQLRSIIKNGGYSLIHCHTPVAAAGARCFIYTVSDWIPLNLPTAAFHAMKYGKSLVFRRINLCFYR